MMFRWRGPKYRASNGCESWPDCSLLLPEGDDVIRGLFAAPSQPANEFSYYMTCTETSDDIIAFWQQKAAIWPRLATVARTILSVPPTETSLECVFSVAGRTMEDRCSQLSVEAIDNLLFIHRLKKSKS